jgi:hypothetical protein
MTCGARQKWLGEMAEEMLAEVVAPRPPMNGAGRNNRWKPYTRERIAQAFREWASLHDDDSPSKNDWSHQGDPEGRWPRASSQSFRQVVEVCARKDGIHISTWAPHRDDPEHQARRAWHEAQHLRRLADGRLESSQGTRGGMEAVARWEPTAAESAELEGLAASPDPVPYCEDCFHGSGCRPADMSNWQYAVEVIGGLQLRRGGDHAATRSRRADFGRNRQMVTAGAADAYPTPSDPSASAVIETIDPGR